MPLEKLTADFIDRDLAFQTGGILQDVLEGPPDALSIFENGPGHWRLEAYFSGGLGERNVQAEVAAVSEIDIPPFVVEPVPDLNWVAMSQAALPPVAAGKFTILGSHDVARIPKGPHSIIIDAGEAFGTAHHATTLGCLLAIDRLTRRGQYRSVLDLGCGSGVLAIAASRALPRAAVLATDMDAQSVKVAATNARINGASKRIRHYHAAGLNHPALRSRPAFDLIIANILAGPLTGLAPHLARKTMRGGSLVLSGILIHQSPAVIAKYRSVGFLISRHDRIAGWSTITLQRA